MVRRFIFNRQRLTTCLLSLLCAVLILTAAGCGDESFQQGSADPVTPASAESGSASFSIQWHSDSTDRSAADALERLAIADCTAVGVASITCEVYDDSQNLIASGGPWPCDAHGGRVENIAAGLNRTFAVLGWNGPDGGGDIVYYGQTPGITITPGEIADAGTIDTYSFIPHLSAPRDNATDVDANDFSFAWDSVATAYGYRILVSEDSGFATLLLDEQTTETTYKPSNLLAATTYHWTVRSIDQFGNESADFQRWRFSTSERHLCVAPVLDPIGNRQTAENATLTFMLSATDPDSSALTFSAASLPAGAAFNIETHTFTWTPGYAAAGNYPATFTVCDDCPAGPLCDSEEMTITVGDVCRPPELNPIGDRKVDENQRLGFTINATDPDGGALSYRAGNLPAGATFSSESHTFNWTPGYGAAGRYDNVTFTVCDDCPDGPQCDSEQVTITVGNVCRPPVLNAIGDQTVDENQRLRFTIGATDPDGGVLSYGAGNLPAGASFDGETHTFSWTPGYGAAGRYDNVTFTVCDDCPEGPQCDSEQVTITVGDICRPPVLNSIGNQTVDENQHIEFTISAKDPDGGVLSYSADNLPTGATFTSKTQTFSWTPGYGTAGTYDVDFVVCDDCPDKPQCDSERVPITVAGVLPVISVVASDPYAAEAVESPDSGTFRVTRTGDTSTSLTVYLSMSGTADNGKDYETIADSITFGIRQSNVSITVMPINDRNRESDETAQLTIRASDAYLLGKPYTATVTIKDDDSPDASDVVGTWQERIDIDCDGSPGINTLIFHDDYTFDSDPRCSGYTGTWALQGDTITFYYSDCDYPVYTGTIDPTGTEMSGTMGYDRLHCWSATKQ